MAKAKTATKAKTKGKTAAKKPKTTVASAKPAAPEAPAENSTAEKPAAKKSKAASEAAARKASERAAKEREDKLEAAAHDHRTKEIAILHRALEISDEEVQASLPPKATTDFPDDGQQHCYTDDVIIVGVDEGGPNDPFYQKERINKIKTLSDLEVMSLVRGALEIGIRENLFLRSKVKGYEHWMPRRVVARGRQRTTIARIAERVSIIEGKPRRVTLPWQEDRGSPKVYALVDTITNEHRLGASVMEKADNALRLRNLQHSDAKIAQSLLIDIKTVEKYCVVADNICDELREAVLNGTVKSFTAAQAIVEQSLAQRKVSAHDFQRARLKAGTGNSSDERRKAREAKGLIVLPTKNVLNRAIKRGWELTKDKDSGITRRDMEVAEAMAGLSDMKVAMPEFYALCQEEEARRKKEMKAKVAKKAAKVEKAKAKLSNASAPVNVVPANDVKPSRSATPPDPSKRGASFDPSGDEIPKGLVDAMEQGDTAPSEPASAPASA